MMKNIFKTLKITVTLAPDYSNGLTARLEVR